MGRVFGPLMMCWCAFLLMFLLANHQEFKKFWEALRQIITFEPLRKKKPVKTMGMLNGRLVPAKHLAVVRKAAAQEHEFDLLPHSDPDIISACLVTDCEQRAVAKGKKLALKAEAEDIKQKPRRSYIHGGIIEKDQQGRYLGWAEAINDEYIVLEAFKSYGISTDEIKMRLETEPTSTVILGDDMEITRIPDFNPDYDILE